MCEKKLRNARNALYMSGARSRFEVPHIMLDFPWFDS